jgi:hypothetical protein
MRKKIALMLLILAFCMWNIYLILGSENKLESRIPFKPEILISHEGHVWHACQICAIIISWFALWLVASWKPFLIFSILFLGYLIDYVLYYNWTMFYIFGWLPVSYTLIMGLIMLFITIKALLYD